MPTLAASIRLSSVAELQEVATGLMRDHWQETEAKQHDWPLDPHWLRYKAIEAHGEAFCLAAWNGQEAVGYAVVIVTPCIKSAGKVLASVDALFVTEEHRMDGIGRALMSRCEAVAKEQGADGIQWHAKPGSVLDMVLRGRRYQHTDNIYRRAF